MRTVQSTSITGGQDYQSQWPGIYFETAFIGRECYFRVGLNHEILQIVVDGQPPLVLTNPEAGLYRISGLFNKPHSVKVFVVTESQQSPNVFGGFSVVAGERTLTLQRPSRQIEFIGDSHTVGYGNTSLKRDCTGDEVWATTNNSQAFGPLTASHYHADYQINAISGRGIVRNYNGSPGDTLPAAYPYVLFDKKQEYDGGDWKPQIVVIGLGTNDFSTPLNHGEKWKTREELHADYEATYVHFIKAIREKNRDAYILLWATDLANDEIKSEVQKVVEDAKAQGESRLSFVPVNHLSFTACHSHPSLADDQTIRDQLVRFIDSYPAIWQGT